MSLEINNIAYQLPGFLLRANFMVSPGEIFCLQAPSGAGKSTLLKVILGALKFTQGELRLNGQDLKFLPIEKRKIGMVFQTPALFPHLNVMENLTFSLKMKKVPLNERMALGDRWLERLSLVDKAKSSIENLSGGERTRLSFARTLVAKPQALLMDEPFNGLDHDLKLRVIDLLKHSLQENPVPVILVSHLREDIELLNAIPSQYHVASTPEGEIRRFFR